MTSKHCINYRKIFKKPIVIFSIGKLKLPIGLEIRRLFTAILICLVLFVLQLLLLNTLIPFLFNAPLIVMVYYILPAYFLSGFLCDEQAIFNGKTAYQFLKGYLPYAILIKAKNAKFSSEEEGRYLQGKAEFQDTRL